MSDWFGSVAEAVRDTPLDAATSAALARYPRLQNRDFVVQWGAPQNDERQLEFFPPWESMSPRAGQPLIEVYNRQLAGSDLENAIAGDMLHYLGAIDPRTGQAIDPGWRALREQFGGTLTESQREVDRRAYVTLGEQRAFDDWMEQARLDAYIRGILMSQWPQHIFTDEQQVLAEQMRVYLESQEEISE